jgi:hypothetical protein
MLADLALINLTPADGGGTIVMHDVIRDHAAELLGPLELVRRHQVLLDGAARHVPLAQHIENPAVEVVAWWQLPVQFSYLWDRLVGHLLAADRRADAEALVTDLRWVQTRLERSGPLIPITDLTAVNSEVTIRLARLLGQNADLLTPTIPDWSVVDILYVRVRDDPLWCRQAPMLSRLRTAPRLFPVWMVPDIQTPALRLTLTGHTGPVTALAIAPDGTWLASAGGYDDSTIRIWDVQTGQQRAEIVDHGYTGFEAVALAPDGTWLATMARARQSRRVSVGWL